MKYSEIYLKKLESQNKYPWSTYESLSKKISILLQFCDIIDKHFDELEESLKLTIKKYELAPCSMLLEYVIHEIQSFYRLSWKNKEKIGITEKDFPEYQNTVLRKFRDRITGHLEDMDMKEFIELYREIDKIGIKNILKDYLKFRDIVIKKLKDTEKT
ncbi:MAG: hypothetical protein ABIE55_03650 [Candidatus Aenigmatarchaeota archaeon]